MLEPASQMYFSLSNEIRKIGLANTLEYCPINKWEEALILEFKHGSANENQ